MKTCETCRWRHVEEKVDFRAYMAVSQLHYMFGGAEEPGPSIEDYGYTQQECHRYPRLENVTLNYSCGEHEPRETDGE